MQIILSHKQRLNPEQLYRVCQDFQPDAPSPRWVQMSSETSLETVLPLSRADEDDWMSRAGFAVDMDELELSGSDTEA